MHGVKWVCAALIAVASASGCAAAHRDVTGTGDDRLDEASTPDRAPSGGSQSGCGPSGKGDLVLIDARTVEPVGCALVTVLRDVAGCEPELDCPTEVVVKGSTSAEGLIALPDPGILSRTRIWAVAAQYAQSGRPAGDLPAGQVAEVEMVPADGFLLKFVDVEGRYLPDLPVTFRQGDQVLAQTRTNALANVYFTSRTPFAGEPVTIEAQGYPPLTLEGPEGFGPNGHTIVLGR